MCPMSQKGFSLIEMMIVIVIIGILGSIAIPSYKEYVIRAKVSEFFSVAEPIKLAITEALMSGKSTAAITTESMGINGNEYPNSISDISVANGVITLTGNTNVLSLPGNKTLRIALAPSQTAQGLIQWKCTTAADTQQYVPAHCRE